MAAIATISRPSRATIPDLAPAVDSPGLDGMSLRIFDVIEGGFGVVAVTGNDAGSHLLQQGEVAVFDERWREDIGRVGFELTPGLYCYERQRTPAAMPNYMVADRFRDNDPVFMDVEREVVFVFRHPRTPEHWAYRQLRSRLHHGVRVTTRIEGPWTSYGILQHLRGPIVGIYRPKMGVAS